MPDKANPLMESIAPDGGSLAGMSVLLTRPAAQVENLAEAIAVLGGTVTLLPMLEIVPVTSGPELERIKTSILALENYDHTVFISTNAATLGLEWIDNYWPQLPPALDAYAVGPGTAQILKQMPWRVHCSAVGVTSEDLLALPGLQEVHGKRIALFRGEGGRELLAETLRARGARVDYIEIYRRRTPGYQVAEVMTRIRSSEVNTVVITSLQILENLLALCEVRSSGDKDAGALLSLLHTSSLLVPSQRVLDRARTAGFNNVVNAGGADDKSMLAAMLVSEHRIQG